MNSHQRRKSRRAVERGYGPRHALNAQEGDELVPEELPSPPASVEEERLRRRRHAGRDSLMNLHPANLVEGLAGELAGLTKEDVAKLGISLLMGGEGPEPMGAGVPKTPRYEGPQTPKPIPLDKWMEMKVVKPAHPSGAPGAIKVDEAGNHFENVGSHKVKDPKVRSGPYTEEEGQYDNIMAKPVPPPGGEPSNVPQPGLKFHDPHPRYEGPPEAVPESPYPWDLPEGGFPGKASKGQTWENLPEWLKKQYPDKEMLTGKDWADIQSYQEAEKDYNPDAHGQDLENAYGKEDALDKQFPSLNKPPYDALKESGSISHLKGQEWLDAYMKKLDEAGLIKEGPQSVQDALDALQEPGSDQHLPEFTEADHNALQDKLGKLEGKQWDAEGNLIYDHGKPLPEGGLSPNMQDPWNPKKNPADMSPQEKQYHKDVAAGKDPGAGIVPHDDSSDFPDSPSKQDIIDKFTEGPFHKGDKSWQTWEEYLKDNPPEDEELPPFEPGAPRYRKGTTGVRHNPKTKTGRPKKIGVEPGFGPRHAANAKEGEDLTQVNTDTVPAMLTPREAVLNRNAAELAGRGNIEQLNQQGNELAKQGVDLASGESNVPDPKAGERRLAGGGAESALLRQLYEKYGNLAPEYLLYPDVLNEIQNQGIGDPQMAQRGTANMKPKPKTPPSKPKPAPKPVKPTAPPSGSPYVQGFQKLMPQGLQGGGYADAMPGYNPRDFPHPMAGKMHQSLPGLGGGAVLGQPGGTLGQPGGTLGQPLRPYLPPGGMTGGPEPYQGANRDFPHPNAGLMHPGGPYSEPPGGYNAGLGGGAILGQPGGTLGQPGGWNPIGGGGGGGEPPGAYGAQPFQGPQGLKGLGSGSFYPKGGQGYADGTTDVTPPIGAANTSAAYGPPIQLTAPDISKILQLEGQKQGLTSSQVAGLAKALQGFKQGYGALANSGMPETSDSFSTGDMGGGGYQGGISDIGYPPMIAPDAEYDPRRGWVGQYNPELMIPRYARGSDDIEPGILGGNRNPDSWLSDLPPGVTVFGGRHPGSGFINRSNYNPGAWSGGAPGMPWSPTKIPTTYDPQGYPYGVPVQGPDQNVQGVGRTHNLRQNQ